MLASEFEITPYEWVTDLRLSNRREENQKGPFNPFHKHTRVCVPKDIFGFKTVNELIKFNKNGASGKWKLLDSQRNLKILIN